LQSNMRELTVELAKAFDIDQHLETATELARKLIFIDKVCADIHHIIEQLED
jgi:molecular chaperone HscB